MLQNDVSMHANICGIQLITCICTLVVLCWTLAICAVRVTAATLWFVAGATCAVGTCAQFIGGHFNVFYRRVPAAFTSHVAKILYLTILRTRAPR